MALRGIKPNTIEKRCKLLLFGPAGVGKTTAAIQFPKPYLIDTERGAENDQYVKLLNQRGGAIFQTSDFDDMLTEVTALLTTKHDYQTVIIDPLTVVYNELLDRSAKSLISKDDPTGTAFSRHKGPADRKVKHLLNLLLRLDMNVVITSHAKGEWKNGAPTGTDTFDCYGKLDYLFDLAIMIEKRGKARFGVVRKTRVEGFKDGEAFEFSYDAVCERYGKDVLERNATPQALATPQQVSELARLVDLLKIDEDTQSKWLDKGQAENWAELSADNAAKILEHLNKKLGGKDGDK